MQSLDGLLVSKVGGLDANPPDESGSLGTEAVIPELVHGHGQVLWLIESGRTSVDVDHELFPSRSNGRVETLPGLEASAEADRSHTARSEEEPIATNHDTLTSGTTWERRENQIKGRDDWQNLVGSIFPGEKA